MRGKEVVVVVVRGRSGGSGATSHMRLGTRFDLQSGYHVAAIEVTYLCAK